MRGQQSLIGVAVMAAAVSACERVRVGREGRPCAGDRCLEGWVCHPELDRCVVPFATDCTGAVERCPPAIHAGDLCAPPGTFVPCIDGISDCAAGCRTCLEDGRWGECSTPPCALGQPWSCQSCSDDCRTSVVDATGVTCAVGEVGACTYTGHCLPGAFDANGLRQDGCECRPAPLYLERCNGIDDDCDGEVDEGYELGQPCGVGVCADGEQECRQNGGDVICSTMPGGSDDRSTAELCDAADNDCDGTVDEGFDQVGACGEGVCSGGVWECAADGAAQQCSTEPGGSESRAGLEVCDALDNDCDGEVDEDFPRICYCSPPAQRACDAGLGPETGHQSCTANLDWDACVLDWRRRVRLDIDNAGITTAQSGVPVLVVLHETPLVMADFADDGADLLFVDADLTTVLPHEVDTWDAAGDSLVWVRVPVIDPTPAAEHLWLYFDDATPVARGDAAVVWSEAYSGVWHLREEVAGTGTADAYADATGLGNDGADLVAGLDKSGFVGAGQRFAPGDRIVVGHAPSLGLTTALTVELCADAREPYWRRAANVTINPATPANDFQVGVSLTSATIDYGLTQPAGRDLRFRTTGGTPLPHWIESWNPVGVSQVWVKVPTAGTTAIVMLYDNPGAPASPYGAADVLVANGLWLTTWDATPSPACADTAAMNTFFNGLTVAARNGWGAVAQINCTNNQCNPYGDDESYAARFEGWINAATAGGYGFATNSDDGSDLLVDGTVVASWYGAHGLAGDWSHAGAATLAAGLHRFAYRFFEGVGGDAYAAAWQPPSATIAVIPASAFLYRQHADPAPSASVGATRVLSQVVAKGSAWGISISGTRVTATVNDQLVGATVAAGWRYLALTYDQAHLQLVVDGLVSGAQAYAAPLWASSDPIVVGDVVVDPGAQGGAFDEVRLSREARSLEWLLLQQRSFSRTLITVGTPEGL